MFATPAQAQVVLSEVYPAPTSEETEWIELFNTSDTTVDLSGWKLFEHFSSKNVLTTFTNVQIEPYAFIIFELPTNKLNNTEEKITLENSDTIEVSVIHYTNSESQKSFSFLFLSETQIGSTLQLVIPTKNAINQLEPIATPTPTVIPSPTVQPTMQPTNSPLIPSTQIPAEPIITKTSNQNLEHYQAISAQLKLPKPAKTEKEGIEKRQHQLSYIVQKKVSKVGVISAIIGGSVLLFIGFLL